MLVVVHRYHRWIGFQFLPTFGSLLPWKLSLRDEPFVSVLALESLGPMSAVHSIFSNRDLSLTLGETKGNINNRYVLEVSWIMQKKKITRGLLIPGLRGFLELSLAIRLSIVSPDVKFLSKLPMYMYTQTYMNYIFLNLGKWLRVLFLWMF